MRVDDREIGPRVNVDELLDHTIGRRVNISIAPSPGAAPRDISVKPVNQTTERGLRYREWVNERRDYVAKASGGRLGYVHMLDMSADALTALSMDLDADNHARDGVVVDVRNNNGGFVNVYAHRRVDPPGVLQYGTPRAADPSRSRVLRLASAPWNCRRFS